jgi:hypothetical protein
MWSYLYNLLREGSKSCGVWRFVLGTVISDVFKNCGALSSTARQFQKISREPVFRWHGVISPMTLVFSHNATRNANVTSHWNFGSQKGIGFLDKLNGCIIPYNCPLWVSKSAGYKVLFYFWPLYLNALISLFITVAPLIQWAPGIFLQWYSCP